MADSPEIPEAKDLFEKKVAISIALVAVIMTFVGNKGDNAKTDAILTTTKAGNQWAFFQSKSVKEHLAGLEKDLLGITAPAGEAASKKAAEIDAKMADYKKEKDEIQALALALQKQAEDESAVNDRCDLSSLFLQIAVVVCSVAILTRWQAFWFAGLAAGLAGAVIGATAFFM